jgi:hypothetical protein
MSKDKRRVFAFGCSYTAYCSGPSWADLLNLDFDYVENWGMPGIGCRAIAERVAECHAYNKFTPDDIVIVQWTTHLRHDYHNPDWTPEGTNNTLNWKTGGSIFSQINRGSYNAKWQRQFFYEPSYVMHCLNHILLTQNLLENTGCTWYMTSIGDWQKLSTDLDDINGSLEKPPDEVRQLSIEENIPEYKPYLKAIWDDRSDKWLKPLALHAQESNIPFQEFFDFKRFAKTREMHPSPEHNVTWLNTYLRPKLGLGDPPIEQKLWCESLEKFREKHYNSLDVFWKNINQPTISQDWWWPNDPAWWPTVFKGY